MRMNMRSAKRKKKKEQEEITLWTMGQWDMNMSMSPKENPIKTIAQAGKSTNLFCTINLFKKINDQNKKQYGIVSMEARCVRKCNMCVGHSG